MTYPNPLTYNGTVELTATVGSWTHRRFLYLSEDGNQITNGSFETDSWWEYWVWDGDCQYEYTNAQARTGSRSMQMRCNSNGRVGTFTPQLSLPAGTYRLRGYVRGLNIQKDGPWGQNTDLLLASGGYEIQPLEMYGTFGWTPLTGMTNWCQGVQPFVSHYKFLSASASNSMSNAP